MREEECSIGLGLGIGRGDFVSSRRDRESKPPPQFHILFPDPRKEEEKEEERQITEQIKIARTRRNNREENTASGDTGDGFDINGGTRKKLRLTKEQSIQLEDSFRKRNTLNSIQKQNLAEKLSLTPRQIEVWFQNRRARTKLKKTEVDCELLKKSCESLSDENQRLRKELQELRAFNSCPSSSSLYVQIHKAATLTMCPSCNRISAKDGCNSSSMAC